ncbi:MAG: 2-C-methyl-D-erythritol 4-phosphate cytidylyltransferase [Acidobacteria bacterium]|nr:2-C-methyl-D-erythritol 4-phosphate cytidylyltransferase [Acidobacteriota bacterium]
MSVAAIVVAGGRGERFGGLKQFAELHGRTLASLSVERCREVAEHVVLVVPSTYSGDGEGADVVIHGGTTRSESVRAGLAVCGDADIIVVHDAVRPNASRALFLRVVEEVRHGAAAAIPGIAVTDTIKTVHGGIVTGTPRREELVAVQTPQAFRASVLSAAHMSEASATDDAALVEAIGEEVHVVLGESGNFKVTEQVDLLRLQREVRS